MQSDSSLQPDVPEGTLADLQAAAETGDPAETAPVRDFGCDYE